MAATPSAGSTNPMGIRTNTPSADDALQKKSRDAFEVATQILTLCPAPFILIMGIPPGNETLVSNCGMDEPHMNDLLRRNFPAILDAIVDPPEGDEVKTLSEPK